MLYHYHHPDSMGQPILWSGMVDPNDKVEDKTKYWDSRTGEKLPGSLVAQAQREELEYFRSMDVYTPVPIETMREDPGHKLDPEL